MAVLSVVGNDLQFGEPSAGGRGIGCRHGAGVSGRHGHRAGSLHGSGICRHQAGDRTDPAAGLRLPAHVGCVRRHGLPVAVHAAP